MKPIGIYNRRPYLSSLIRFLSLTPSSQSNSKLFQHILPYIFHATLYGAAGCAPDSNETIIFLQTGRFTADYPASSPLLGVNWHNAIFPCTCCLFSKKRVVAGF